MGIEEVLERSGYLSYQEYNSERWGVRSCTLGEKTGEGGIGGARQAHGAGATVRGMGGEEGVLKHMMREGGG